MGTIAEIVKTDNWVIGEEKQINIDVNQADGTTAQTMTGWALRWRLQARKGGPTLIEKTTSAGITIGNGDGTDDRASIEIDTIDYSKVANEGGTFHHVLDRTDSGSKQVLSFGPVYLHELQV